MTKAVLSLVLVLLLTLPAGSAWAVQYQIRDLGPVGGFSYHFQINNSGQITAPTGYPYSAQVWDVDGNVRNIGSELPYGDDSATYAINDNGEVAVYAHGHVCSWSEATGGVDRHALPSSQKGCPLAINNAGDIVGWAYTPYDEHACLWKSDGSVVDLGLGSAVDINNQGEILIQRDYDSVQVLNADSTLTPVHAMTKASAMNDAGMVVGYYWNFDNHQPYLWSAAADSIALPFLSQNQSAVPNGINSLGEIVGYSVDANGYDHAVLWDANRNIIDLGSLSSLPHSYAFDISDNGWIVGCASVSGQYSGGDTHLVVWQPVPEPSSMLALLCGIGSFGGLLIRRK